jgi:hypothetical protein
VEEFPASSTTPRLSPRHVNEAGVVPLERHGQSSCGAVSVLEDVDIGFSWTGGFLLVHVGPVKAQNQIEEIRGRAVLPEIFNDGPVGSSLVRHDHLRGYENRRLGPLRDAVLVTLRVTIADRESNALISLVFASNPRAVGDPSGVTQASGFDHRTRPRQASSDAEAENLVHRNCHADLFGWHGWLWGRWCFIDAPVDTDSPCHGHRATN